VYKCILSVAHTPACRAFFLHAGFHTEAEHSSTKTLILFEKIFQILSFNLRGIGGLPLVSTPGKKKIKKTQIQNSI
jgi:hypothetical protein